MRDLSQLLDEVTGEVLENMFFSGVMGELETPESERPAAGERLRATVAFTGTSSGALGVSAPASTAAVLAAGFLGADGEEVADSQIRAVVGELANVLCGVVLGRINPEGQFVISPPAVGDETAVDLDGLDIRKRFEIMEGDLSVGLTVH